MDKSDIGTGTEILVQNVFDSYTPPLLFIYNCCFTLPLAVWQGLIAVTKKERPKYIGATPALGNTPPKQNKLLIYCFQDADYSGSLKSW